jgi:hypothetical protein
MSNAKGDAVRGRLKILLETDGGVQRAFLLVDAKKVKVTLEVDGVKRSMSLGAGHFAVLMLSPAELGGKPAGIYDPDAGVDAKEKAEA